MTGKLAIVLLSGNVEKLAAGAIIGAMAAQYGMDVKIFASMNALLAFRKEALEKKEFITEGVAGKVILEKSKESIVDMLKKAKETGKMKIYACSMIMDMMGLKKEDLVDIFDDVVGVATFLSEAEGYQILIF